MNDINNDGLDNMNHIIKGTYVSSDSINPKINSILETIYEYTNERNYMEQCLYNIQYINQTLSQKINYLQKRCDLINITHSNTMNFILANYIKLKKLLDNYITVYNNNLDNMLILRNNIYSLNFTIHFLKTELHNMGY